MGNRRPLKPKLRPEYEFQSMEECEESDKYGGMHRVEPTKWPPKAEHGELRPYASARCTRCGCHCLAYADNNPDESGIEVVIPEKKVREKVTA